MPLEDKPKEDPPSQQEGAVGGATDDADKMDQDSNTNTHELDSSGEGEVFKRQRINSPKRPSYNASPGGKLLHLLKRYIYKCWVQETCPLFSDFKNLVIFYEKVEKRIALNRDKYE